METLISTTSVQSLNELQKSDYTRQSSRIVVSVIATRRHAPCLRRIAKTKRIFYELSCMTIAVPKCQQDNFSWQRLFWINGQSIHPNLDTIMKWFFLFELRNSIHGIGNGSTWSTGPCEMWRHVESLERIHDDVIKWKHFLRYWPLVRGIPVTGEFPSQRPMARSFDIFFDLRLSKRLSKQSGRRWFKTPSRPLWRHCNVECEISVPYNHGPLTSSERLWVANAPGRRERFLRHRVVSDSDMHHGTCVTRVPWCMPGSLTSGFLWIRWRGKRSRHSRRRSNLQFYVSGKRPMPLKYNTWTLEVPPEIVRSRRAFWMTSPSS